MPEVDGLDILRYVRSNTQLADLPVISECQGQQLEQPSILLAAAPGHAAREAPATHAPAAAASATRPCCCSDVCQRAKGHRVPGHPQRR